jgi:hypothetical protein
MSYNGVSHIGCPSSRDLGTGRCCLPLVVLLIVNPLLFLIMKYTIQPVMTPLMTELSNILIGTPIPTPIAVLLISTLDETPMNGLEKPIIVYHKKIFCIYNNY